MRILDDQEWREKRTQHHEKPPLAGIRSSCQIDPYRSRPGDEREQIRQPDVFDTPPGIEHRASNDDEIKSQRGRQQKMQCQIDQEKNKKWDFAE